MSILEFLAEKDFIDASEIDEIKEEVRSKGKTLDDILTSRAIMPADLLKAKGEYYSVPSKIISNAEVPFNILKYVPEESALHYKFIPIGMEDGFLEIGMVDPSNIEARDALNFISSKEDLPFKIYLISEEDFSRILNVYKGMSGQVTQALEELDSDDIQAELDLNAKKKVTQKEIVSEQQIKEDAPVTKIVGTIIRYAVEGGASDVHVERMREKIRVRFRVDGVLNTSLILPAKVHSAVVARIKILSKLKLDEKRKPQDGRFSAKIEDRRIDFRVSTFPTYYGEKVVMRILDQQKGVKKIEELGLSDRYLKMLREAIKRPYGLILISGPTGSGKTTTLYSILNELDSEKYNILSLEDPVEYSVDGVSQSQVRAEIGYTFATGLRTTLRQDPDIIMVGEIRDAETARLAIQASLTGHLVLSTIHTNTATGIVPRLIDMGVDPYLIPPTLILGIAQRLVRLICPGSGEEVPVEGSIKSIFDQSFKNIPEQYMSEITKGETVLKIKPTSECPTGTRGREAVFEMFAMNSEIEKVILENPVDSVIFDAARKNGMFTMKEDAIRKAMKKEIPFEEVNKL